MRDLLFADDCALLAHTQSAAQELFNRFATAAARFGLTVSLKTEVMLQSTGGMAGVAPSITAGSVALKAVDQFCYLGGVLSNAAHIDEDVSARLAKACASFGKLTNRLWSDHGIRLTTKVAEYRAVVLTSLLYGCESWTLYRRHIQKLEQFHMRCLRKIAHVRWQDKVPNTEVLARRDMQGIEAHVIAAQLRSCGTHGRLAYPQAGLLRPAGT